jgi:hypothetical protein
VVFVAVISDVAAAAWRPPVVHSGFSPVSLVDSLPMPSFAVPDATSAQQDVAGAPLSVVIDAADRAVAPGMTAGVAVLDLSTGELVQNGNGRRQFYSASLAKLLLVVDMLDRRRTNGLTIPASDLELVGRALRASDDDAMNALWGTYGGPSAIDRVAAQLGLVDTDSPDDPTQWGETEITAADFARLYQHILREMPAEDQHVITDNLASAQHTAADGFDQFFGLLANGASGQRYAKQGWMSYLPATTYLHSAGVVHDPRTGKDYAVALLSTQTASYQNARARLSTMAGAVLAALGIG